MKPERALTVVEAAAQALVDPGARSSTPHLVVELTDFAQAKDCAWDQMKEFAVDPGVIEQLMNATDYDPCLDWTGMREHMAAELHTSALKKQAPADYGDRLIETVMAVIASNPEAMEVANDIVADLSFCALSLIGGPRGGFWDRVLFAYQHGFWPCGWEGTFPDMRLVGYRFVR